MHLRSVELQMPDRAAAVEFLQGPWGLIDAGTRNDTTYLRGTGALHYVIAVSAGPDRAVLSATLRCGDVHHVVAYADAKQATLNHIAFEMRDADAVMRGMGRLKDAGCASVWGPGRHGPGNNVFAYFVAPFGACIEYTAEVQRVDDGYRTGTPESWQWPAGRSDHWGIASRDNGKLAASSDTFPYRAIAT